MKISKETFFRLFEEVRIRLGTWLVWLGFKVLRGFVPEIWRHQKVSDKRQLEILQTMFKQNMLSGEIKLSEDKIQEIRNSVEVLNKNFKLSSPVGLDEVFTMYVERLQELREAGFPKDIEKGG